MLTYDAETLRKIQLIQLEMLIEVDRICKKCGIHYNIIAGTLLGAVRHGGFIPWDDDADVAMLRSEYDRFVKAAARELDTSRFYFQDHRTTPGYRWGYGKLRRKDTLFLREHQEHMPYPQGIFIDIFPLDQVPESRIGRMLVNFECFLVRKVLYSPVGRIADKNALKRVVYSALSHIPDKTVFGYYEGMIRRASWRNSSMVRILMFPTPNDTYMYYKRWYENSADITFENHTFSGIVDWDGYLSFKFGSYMELPPEEQRKTHPVSRLKVVGEDEL